MKTLLMTALLLGPAAPCAAGLKAVSTVPDLADMARRVGGGRVSIETLSKGTEDIHQIVMRPSHVTRLNRAEAVLFLGLGVEHSFLPGLLEVAANPKAKPAPDGCAGPACVDASKGIAILDVPKTVSRADGELHPSGNPHYNLGPQNGAAMARNVAAGLSRLDPAGAAEYEKNLAAYLAELEPAVAELKRKVKPLEGVKAVSYHKDIAYFGAFTGLDFVGTVELKPGIAPTPTHLKELVELMKRENVRLIVREQQYDAKSCEWLAKQTGARVAVIGTLVGALPGADTWLELARRNVAAVLEAAGKGGS